jgi:FMN-dependent NADH-azoreductase
MNKLLHIIATPRVEESRTLEVSRVFLEAITKKYPACLIDELNVATEQLPGLTFEVVAGKYVLLGGKELSAELKGAWRRIEQHIERFLSADSYLISTPMWNFSIPHTLKQYIDIIVQPKYLFRYIAGGVEGLAKNKRMAIVISRGGDYGPESAFHAYDFQGPYLRTIFGFVGITDMNFIIAEPMDALGPDVRKKKIEEAKILAGKIADSLF